MKIIEHHFDFIELIRSLRFVEESKLRKPIAEGKWSVVEIVGHFIAWDQFVLRDRIPYFFTENIFPAGPNVNVLNEQAARNAREEEVSFVLDAFLSTRGQIVEKIIEIPEELWFAEIKINQSELTLYSYFEGLMEHDLHHIEQIKEAIK
ncbi:DinB family protein [Bacillus ndiopicus]|uniref:DinB family protein n=1 Tax=Bacillus ndiopicus TaxID=1347368 RepID=UPI0005A770FF|nr:DinB family protein [Bacillus ndiopicus]